MESVSPNQLSSHLELPKVVSSNLQVHQYFPNSPSLTPFPSPVKITLKVRNSVLLDMLQHVPSKRW